MERNTIPFALLFFINTLVFSQGFIEQNQSFSNSNFDCIADFYTVNYNGEIQQWNIENNTIVGGEIVLTGSTFSGLAYCSSINASTFYCPRPPDLISYYDENFGWLDVPVQGDFLNNGGYENDHYFMGNLNSELIYFDGNTTSLIGTLNLTVADIAVDVHGQAWVFGGDGATTDSLYVFNVEGQVAVYDINFNSNSSYGSFFLNDVLYIGMGALGEYPNSIVPIIINGNSAQFGTPISFVYSNYADMASCRVGPILGTPENSSISINISPNPTTGIINIPKNMNVTYTEVFNLSGQLITKSNNDVSLDMAIYSKGIYILKIHTKSGIFVERIIKN
jgi:hypothetical protein